MPATIETEFELHVGEETLVDSSSPSQPYGTVFEDNGETAYFYALDLRAAGQRIQDAVHIYDVEDVTDRDLPSTVQIALSSDGLKAGLFINRYPHAVIDS